MGCREAWVLAATSGNWAGFSHKLALADGSFVAGRPVDSDAKSRCQRTIRLRTMPPPVGCRS